MILVLASIADDAAAAFVEEFADVVPISLMTCRDLAEEPTALRHPDTGRSMITVGGRAVPTGSVGGVVNVLPVVFPEELFFYPPEEREYQAAEFHAMLSFWLRALPCPVVNRPTPSSLTGPYASIIGWYHLADRLSIPIAPAVIDSDVFVHPLAQYEEAETVEVSCLDGKLIVASGTPADRATLELAAAADVVYLRAVYLRTLTRRLELLAAHSVPDVRSAATRGALVDFFRVSWATRT